LFFSQYYEDNQQKLSKNLNNTTQQSRDRPMSVIGH